MAFNGFGYNTAIICFCVSLRFLWFKHLPNLKQSQYSPKMFLQLFSYHMTSSVFFFLVLYRDPWFTEKVKAFCVIFTSIYFKKVSIFCLWQFLLFNCNLAQRNSGTCRFIFLICTYIFFLSVNILMRIEVCNIHSSNLPGLRLLLQPKSGANKLLLTHI